MTSDEKIQLYKLLDEKDRRKARVNYFTFLRRMAPPEFRWNWHHEYVCNILQEWIMTDNFPYLMLFMPPQHQKTTMLIEYLVPWAFGQSPDYQIILTMATATMSKKYNRKIQRHISTPEYKLIFPHVKIADSSVSAQEKEGYVKNSEEMEVIGTRGFLRAAGVDGMIAGNPAKIGLLDDFYRHQNDANSLTIRDKIDEWYKGELNARLHNDSKLAITITRRHEDDQAGRLLKRDGTIEEGGKWKVIKLPALKVDNTNPDDPREIGEALFPELHSRERMEEKQEKEPRIFEGLYQQEPYIKGGDKIKADWFVIKKPSELPFDINSVPFNAVIDGAWTEKQDNDPTGYGYCYYHKADHKLYIRSIKDFKKRLSKAAEYLSADARINGVTGASSVHVELKASGYGIMDLLLNKGFNAIGINNDLVKLGKETRVEGVEPSLSSGRVVLIDDGTGWIKSFISQCEQFPNAKHDDKVDVLTYMIYIYLIKGVNPYLMYQ